jgi:hypothetical protein
MQEYNKSWGQYQASMRAWMKERKRLTDLALKEESESKRLTNQQRQVLNQQIAEARREEAKTKKAMLGSIGDTMIKARNRYRFTFSVA